MSVSPEQMFGRLCLMYQLTLADFIQGDDFQCHVNSSADSLITKCDYLYHI